MRAKQERVNNHARRAYADSQAAEAAEARELEGKTEFPGGPAVVRMQHQAAKTACIYFVWHTVRTVCTVCKR